MKAASSPETEPDFTKYHPCLEHAHGNQTVWNTNTNNKTASSSGNKEQPQAKTDDDLSSASAVPVTKFALLDSNIKDGDRQMLSAQLDVDSKSHFKHPGVFWNPLQSSGDASVSFSSPLAQQPPPLLPRLPLLLVGRERESPLQGDIKNKTNNAAAAPSCDASTLGGNICNPQSAQEQDHSVSNIITEADTVQSSVNCIVTTGWGNLPHSLG